MTAIYQIKDWDQHYENNRTRGLKHLDWVPIPNRMDGGDYTELLDHENGAAHFGVWIALVEIASRCEPRGTLLRDTQKPHDLRSLSRMSRINATILAEAIPRLLEIKWLVDKSVASNDMQDGAGSSQEGAAESQESVPSRAHARTSIPFPSSTEVKKDAPKDERYKLDETYEPFVAAYLSVKPDLITEDFIDAHHPWRYLDYDQKKLRLDALNARIASGTWTDPFYVTMPRKFIEREWRRPISVPQLKKSKVEELFK